MTSLRHSTIRRLKYYDSENEIEFVFITNNFEISGLEIATLYKSRWTIELFFKWIKKYLKVKSFLDIALMLSKHKFI